MSILLNRVNPFSGIHTGLCLPVLFFRLCFWHTGTLIWEAVPVVNLKLSLAFYAWCIIGVYLLFQIKLKLMVLGSFVAPLAALFIILSSAIPASPETVPLVFKSIWLVIHVFTMFHRVWGFKPCLYRRSNVPDSGTSD